MEGLGDGNWLQSHKPVLRKVTLKLWFRLQRCKGSNPTLSPICCVILDVFFDTLDFVGSTIKGDGGINRAQEFCED